jgi:hypothetical protein
MPLSSIPNSMTKSVSSFQRKLNQQLRSELKAEKLYTQLENDIRNQFIFPCIRKDLIDFYYKGGRLFKFDKDGFHTHIKFAAVIEKTRDDYLTEKQLSVYRLATDFSSNYARIKENCAMYSGVEANGVSELYRKHSYVIKDKGIVVLDIEVSLQSINADKKQDRIDILLFNIDERKLKFVEAKHYSNSEIWSRQEAKVIGQIKRYQDQILTKKSEIITEYNNYTDIVNRMFSCNLPMVNDIEDKVTLLIFGFDNDQKKGRLHKLITGNENYFKDITVYPIGNIDKINLKNLWKAR